MRIETVELDDRNLAHATSPRLRHRDPPSVRERSGVMTEPVGSDRGLRRHRCDRWRFASADQLHLQRPGARRPSGERMEAAMTESKHPDEMSDAELAEHHWQHRDDALGEEVDFEIVKPLRVTMSFRLPAEEADAIREAAAAAGTSLSEWIRWATMRAARDIDIPPPRHAAISRARELLSQAEAELGRV